MWAVDVGMQAIPEARKQETVLAGLEGQILFEWEATAAIGIQSLVNADLCTALQGTGAGIVKELENKPKIKFFLIVRL